MSRRRSLSPRTSPNPTGPDVVTKEVGASIGIGEEDGVAIIVVESSGPVGATEAELREIVDVELEKVLDNRPRLVRHQLQFDRSRSDAFTTVILGSVRWRPREVER